MKYMFVFVLHRLGDPGTDGRSDLAGSSMASRGRVGIEPYLSYFIDYVPSTVP